MGRDFGATPTCGPAMPTTTCGPAMPTSTCGPAMPTPSCSGDVTVLRRAWGAKNGFFGRVVGGQDVHDLGLVVDQ